MKAVVFGLAMLAAAPASAMSLTSSDFRDGAELPIAHVYTRCGGQNVSPALSWRGIPATAQTMVLTMIDINVKPHLWSHWVVTDIAPDTTGFARGEKTLPGGAHGVISNFGDDAYGGPCPPDGTGVHHYRFTLWALPRPVSIAPGTNASDLQAALSQVAIDKAVITGWVKR